MQDEKLVNTKHFKYLSLRNSYNTYSMLDKQIELKVGCAGERFKQSKLKKDMFCNNFVIY